jgi:3',5'-cyclic AMP phosphodiesterase CpdA
VNATRVLVVSDSHLTATAAEAGANWDAVVAYAESERPDVVVHLGDLSFDGANRADDLDHAREQLDRLPVPWRAIPGNHDIGDNPTPGASDHQPVIDDVRRDRWLDVVGPDRWTLDLDGWRLVAVDAQLFDSGLAAKADQWAWLEDELAACPAGSALALLTHKPLVAPDDELAIAPNYRFVPEGARRRLAGLLGDRASLVVSGHVHQYRVLDRDGCSHVWAPTTWAVLPEATQPTFGLKRCGVLDLALDAGGDVQQELVEPPGLAQLTVGR